LIAELALFVAKITRSLLNLAPPKQKLLGVGLISPLAAGAADVWGASRHIAQQQRM
jgi:hypothetical protein